MEFLILSAIVVGFVECAKMAGLNTRYAPLLAILVSVGAIFLYSFLEKMPLNWVMVQNGLIAGLSAVGLYSGVKTTVK